MMPFNLGDVVKLKSGGPNMTITKLPDPDARDQYNQTCYGCTWWNHPESKYEIYNFLEEALQHVPDSLIG